MGRLTLPYLNSSVSTSAFILYSINNINFPYIINYFQYKYKLNIQISSHHPMIQQRIIKADHSSQPSNPNQQNSQIVVVSNPLSPDLFLFQQIVIDILNYCKRNLKVQPFDDMQVDKLVQANKSQSIDIYQQYFLLGIGSLKTREFVCNKYEQLVRDNLINKENLPTHMITGVINARSVGPSGGGSTASSGSNSIVGSATNINIQKSLSIAKLINTIICSTIQPSSQIHAGLLYILEASRNKNNGALFVQIMEDLYSNLSKFRKKPIDRFIMHFVSRLVSEVEYHESIFIQYEQKYINQQKKSKNNQNQANYQKIPSIMRQGNNSQALKIPDPPPMFQFIRKQVNPYSKQALCVHHKDQDAKFGKCFICDRGANNYDKTLFVPLCSMQCKNKLKRINQQCIMNDHFSFLKWILDTLTSVKSNSGNGDEILYSLLLREVVQTQKLALEQIGTIMEIIVNNFSLQAIGISSIQSQLANVIQGSKNIENSALIMSHLVRKYPSVMFSNVIKDQEQNIMRQGNQVIQESQNRKSLTRPNLNNTKIIITQMVRLLETLPVQPVSLQLNLLKSLIQILSSKQYVSQSKSFCNMAFRQLYINCDCNVLQTNLVERIFNIISQYALQGTNVNNPKQSSTSQNIGTSSSISIQSPNSGSLSMINNGNISGSSGAQTAILGLEELLTSLVQTMNYFNEVQGDAIRQKKIKKYIETKFVQQFNKKPIKAVDKLRKMFNNKITAKDIAIILRQNMEYEYEIKVKKFREYINKQQVGTYFGTLKKDKNTNQDFNQKVYWQFLHLLQNQFQGKQIDDCLRITFNAFNMPKEGQQVQVVLGPLSLVLEPFLGLKEGAQATATYQLIMVTLMVQTSNKPNVKQGQKLKLDGFKKFCSQFDQNLSEARITQIYNRMKQRPLQILMEYRGNDVFTKKYLKKQQLETDFWKGLDDLSILQQKSESTLKTNEQSISKKQAESKSQVKENKKKQQMRQQVESRSSLQLQQSRVFQSSLAFKNEENVLSFAMLNLWQYVYMSIVNKNNLRGLQYACILYGKCQLLNEFQAFFNHLYKLHQDLLEKPNSFQAISNQAKLIILKLAIDQSNYVIGRHSWLIIIKIIYKLDSQQDENIKPISKKPQNSYSYYEYEASDKLFTRTNTFKSERLKQFMQAMCQFSSSEVKTDKKYTRQMYILHHITQIIEYNLERFKGQVQDQKSIWSIVWPTIRSYFRNICIHPRKEISMSAIDSYKQLTMKMLKLDSNQISHNELMSLYLYVFERSPAYIKDLIINILLNVVCREMKAGWNQLYTILEISDSQDKNVVMKVVTRLIKDIGMEKIGNLLRLHQIIIKQLRICNESGCGQAIDRLWQVCQCFNRLDIWLQTLSKIKDIYKSTSSVQILTFLYKVCNKCIQIAHKQNKNVGNSPLKNSNDQQCLIEQKVRQMESKIEEKFMNEAYQEQILPKQNISATFQLDQVYRLVYFEVFSVQMHILEIKSTKLFADSINIFTQLDLDVFFKYLGNGGVGNSQDNRTGFLALWQMFLSSNHAVNFSFFLHEYLSLVFNNLSKMQKQFNSKNTQQKKVIKSFDQLNNIKRQIFLWLIRVFLQTSKDEIIQLCQQDSDLSKPFSQILQTQSFPSSKTQLIQFYLSSKQYEARSIQHLVFLKIFKSAFEAAIIGKVKEKDNPYNNTALDDLSKRILEGIVQSYETASEVNDKPLLRNFLWNNEFFKGHDYLPGLMKQQLRSFELIVKYFDIKQMQGKICKLILNFIKKFSYKASLIWKKYNKETLKKKDDKPSIQIIKPEQLQQNQAIQRITQILYQDLGLWVTNSQQITAVTLRKLAIQIKQHQQNKGRHQYFQYRKMFDMCMELSKFAASPLVLKETSGVLQELIIKLF